MAVFLVSELCRSTHGIYSASLGRYARVFIATGSGWIGPRTLAPSADDVAAHFYEIADPAQLSFPESLTEEFRDIIRRLKTT